MVDALNKKPYLVQILHHEGYNFIETAKLAAAYGATNCIRKDFGMFYKKDVEHLFENCDVSEKQLN